MEQAKKAQLSRDEIIRVATHEFSDYGYENASINRICRDGNISKGRLYHYFRDKPDIFVGCFERHYQFAAEYMNNFEANSELTLKENLLLFFKTWQSFWQKHPFAIRLIVEAKVLPPSLQKERIATVRYTELQKITDILNSIIKQYIDDERTQALLVKMIWVIIEYLGLSVGGTEVDPKKDFQTLLDSQRVRFEEIIDVVMFGVMPR